MVIIFRIFLIIYFGLVKSLNVLADAASAKTAWDKAYNDYYRAILPLKDPTPAQLSELRTKMVGPAEGAYLSEKQTEHLKSHPVNSGKASGKPVNSKSSRSSSPTGIAREEFILEGTDIPKEMEFPGIKARLHSPKPKAK